MFKEIIKNSYSIYVLVSIYNIYQRSVTRDCFNRMYIVYKNSITHKKIDRYMTRNPYYSLSKTYSSLNKTYSYMTKKIIKLRLFMLKTIQNSKIIKLLLKLKIDENIFLYFLALYSLVDYSLRKALPSIAGIWDDAYLMLLIIISIVTIILRSKKNLKYSPIDFAIFGYILINVLIAFILPYDKNIVIAGLRANTFFILWFYVIFQMIDEIKSIENIFKILVFVGFVVSLYGVYQYVVGVPMPKSSWVDSVEVNVKTRAFSIIGSPNILGSLIVLISPLSLGLLLTEKRVIMKLVYIMSYITMITCLVFTLSRGAWIVYVIGMSLFILIRDKRLLTPAIIGLLLVIIFVPSIQSRVGYMISPEYIKSSLKGGRLIRWITGLEMIKEAPIFGVGLGHFGGAVAYNFRIPNTFYLDNYYLKTAVEIGLLGFVFFQYLMFTILKFGMVAINRVKNNKNKELLIASYVGVFSVTIHNYVENVFEVPMMVTYYYLIVACMFNLWFLDKGTYAKEGKNA